MKFCHNCGNELRDEAVMCPKCGAEAEVTSSQIPEQKDTKFCTYCGAEVLQAAVICPKCGCPFESNNSSNKTKTCNGLQTAAKIFLIIGCVLTTIVAVRMAILTTTYSKLISDPEIDSTTSSIWGMSYNTFFLILTIITMLPLAWQAPMTTYYFKSTANKEPVSIVFKILTLLFVNLIAGILMLCDYKNNK